MPNAALQAEIKCRLAPFWFENYIVQPEGLHAGSMGHYPLTLISEILGNCDSPSYVTSIAASLPGIPPLWYAATTGLQHQKFEEALDKTDLERRCCDFREEHRSSFVRSIITKDTKTILQDAVATATPFQLTMMQIGLYRSLKYQYWTEPALVIVGDTVEDFCLYYCLSRSREEVTWLIPAWVHDFQLGAIRAESGGEKLSGQELTATWFFHGIGELTRYGQKRALLLSASMALPDLSTLRDALLETAMVEPHGNQLDVNETAPAVGDILRFPLVAYETDNQHRDTTMHFTNQEITGLFDTPKPKNFKRIDPKDHRWITEFSIVHHRFPRHASLGSWVVPDQRLGTPGARCGLNGVAYFCPNIAYFGGDIDTVLVRPKMRIPDAIEIFEYLAQQAQLTCKVSDKGFFAQDTIRKFGDLEKLGIFLRDEPKRTLLDKFLGASKPGPGVDDEGVFLNDNRRYLNFACITKILGTADKATALIDDLIRARVFQRGFVFKCAFCRNADWFSVNDLTQEFECKRCNRRQVYARDHWRKPEEPRWFYKLDEIVYQGHRNDMTVPLLALDYLRRSADDSFLYSSELEFYKPDTTKPFAEADLCCIPSGVLTIGEAKKADRPGQTAEEEERIIVKYRDLSELLAPRQIVFATMAASWAGATRAKIIEGFAGKITRPIFLTSAELLNG